MKTTLAILASSCLLASLAWAQPAINAGTGKPTSGDRNIVGYQIGKQGTDYRIWQKIVPAMDSRGRAILQTNRAYVELASGMNHLIDGKWVESKEEIDILPDGTAAATNGQHQVYIPGDIYQGQIRLVTPDGKQLRSRPLGLSYFDGNKSVLIAELKDSTGWLVGSNQVVYPDAFTDFKADLRYTYTKAGFEQDIILKEQPPTPESFGLDPDTARLQVLTEFFDPPQPSVTATTVPTAAGDLPDDLLSFGTMQVGRGKAFLLGTDSAQAEVNKQWLELEGRQFLVEEVPVASIADQLNTLPAATLQTSLRAKKQIVSKHLVLPPRHLARATAKSLLVAKMSMPSHGLVLDYVTLNANQTSYTFQGDTTYYISGTVYLYGTNNFEGGSVLKYASNASLTIEPSMTASTVNWRADAYRPVVFTAVDDNSVGETISGSTGNPTNYYANPALGIVAATPPLIDHFRVVYARQAVSSACNNTSLFYNGQIIDSLVGFAAAYGSTCCLRNILFSDVQTNITINYMNVDVQNSTFNSSAYLTVVNSGYQTVNPHFTNCVFVNVSNLTNNLTLPYLTYSISGDHNGFYNCPNFGSSIISSGSYPFQSVGGGNCYLTNGCNFVAAATTNIDSTLLTNLRKRTTQMPILLTNLTISTNTILYPQAQRDTGMPDLGYHYDPIDYIVDNLVVTNAALTLTNGVTLATYDEAGIVLQDNSSIVSVGTPLYPNWLVRYLLVQEQTISTNEIPALGVAVQPSCNSVKPNGCYRFTKFVCPAEGGTHLCDTYSNLTVQDCEFWGGTNSLGGSTTAILKNNLFARSVISASGAGTLSLSNNLVWGTTNVMFNPSVSNAWSAYNNDFDSSTITGTNLNAGYNAYLKCTGRLYPTNANDIVTNATLAYQTSWLGGFYQPTNSPLIHNGSTTADQVGLYHYTITTNQVIEGTNTVSIGYHYVATDSSGNPLDADGDGIPDYLEDSNGDGVFNAGDISNWQSYNSANGLTNGNGLMVFTPLK